MANGFGFGGVNASLLFHRWRDASPSCAGSFRRRLSTRACASRAGC